VRQLHYWATVWWPVRRLRRLCRAGAVGAVEPAAFPDQCFLAQSLPRDPDRVLKPADK